MCFVCEFDLCAVIEFLCDEWFVCGVGGVAVGAHAGVCFIGEDVFYFVASHIERVCDVDDGSAGEVECEYFFDE